MKATKITHCASPAVCYTLESDQALGCRPNGWVMGIHSGGILMWLALSDRWFSRIGICLCAGLSGTLDRQKPSISS
jgi:hypothetical protein